jgi:hypothetical protein
VAGIESHDDDYVFFYSHIRKDSPTVYSEILTIYRRSLRLVEHGHFSFRLNCIAYRLIEFWLLRKVNFCVFFTCSNYATCKHAQFKHQVTLFQTDEVATNGSSLRPQGLLAEEKKL